MRSRFVRGYVVLVGFKRGPVNCNGKHVNLMKPETKQQHHKNYVWEVWYFETHILSTIVDILTYTWNIASLYSKYYITEKTLYYNKPII